LGGKASLQHQLVDGQVPKDGQVLKDGQAPKKEEVHMKAAAGRKRQAEGLTVGQMYKILCTT